MENTYHKLRECLLYLSNFINFGIKMKKDLEGSKTNTRIHFSDKMLIFREIPVSLWMAMGARRPPGGSSKMLCGVLDTLPDSGGHRRTWAVTSPSGAGDG